MLGTLVMATGTRSAFAYAGASRSGRRAKTSLYILWDYDGRQERRHEGPVRIQCDEIVGADLRGR